MKPTFVVLAGLALIGLTAWACGPFYTANYLANGLRTVDNMAGLGYAAEIERLLRDKGYAAAVDNFQAHARAGKSEIDRWADTNVRAKADFAEAIAGRSDAVALQAAYNRVRVALEEQGGKRIRDANSSAFPGDDADTPPPSLPTLDAAPLEADIALMPVEFERYLRGAIAWHNRDLEAAITHFKDVLALPPGERPYRSTWAAYMLGKILAPTEPASAATWFAQVIQLEGEGFRDTLNLAEDARILMARAEADAGDAVRSIHHYAEAGMLPECRRIRWGDVIDPAVAEDPLAREILTIYLIAFGDQALGAKWLSALEKSNALTAMPDAGRQAWALYRSGDMEAADRWAALAPQEDTVALWVRGKLALRAGKLEEGAKLLEAAAEALPENMLIDFDGDFHEIEEPTVSAREAAWGDVAFDKLLQHDYVAAFRSFLLGGQTDDAEILATRVFDAASLNAISNAGLSTAATAQVCRMQAQALARAGAWDTAAAKFAEFETIAPEGIAPEFSGAAPQSLSEAATAMHRSLLESDESKLPKQQRAEATLNAARLLGNQGNQLMGSVSPFECTLDICLQENERVVLPPWAKRELCSTELTRQLATTEPSDRPLAAYRYTAADLYWKAARLLPDNDPLLAKALYDGGLLLKNDDPKAADRFYKALVRRNPKLLIAQQADELRWFPGQFTDEIATALEP